MDTHKKGRQSSSDGNTGISNKLLKGLLFVNLLILGLIVYYIFGRGQGETPASTIAADSVRCAENAPGDTGAVDKAAVRTATETTTKTATDTITGIAGDNRADASAKTSSSAPGVPVPHGSVSQKYPFSPMGCPFVFIKGSNRKAMADNKTVTARVYGRSYTITIGNDHPNGVRALITTGSYGQNLAYDGEWSEDDTATYLDEYDDLNASCNMQVTLMDFNNDGECELFLTYHSAGSLEMKTQVFALLKKPYNTRIARYIGSIWGQSMMYADRGTIVAPYGSQGLYEQYVLRNGKLINL